MTYPFYCDSHCHSDNSRDGYDTVLAMCRRAAELGLRAITVTDHCEIDEYYSDQYHDSIRRSYEQIMEAKEALKGQIEVYAGLELGQAIHCLDYAEDAVNSNAYDFVLASVHNIREEQDFFFLDYTKTDVAKFLSLYFDELLELVQWGKFDSLAHLTYPLRYIVGEHRIPVNVACYSEKIAEILQALVNKEKALEINTSGLRQPIGETIPNIDIVRQFYALGGRLVTLGSDAHRVTDLGKGIAQGCDLMNEVGFTHVALYENRRPRLLPVK